MKPNHIYMLLKVKVWVNDNAIIDSSERAVFFSFDEAEREMHRWVKQDQGSHVLCFLIRKVPIGKPYLDKCVEVGPCKAETRDSPDERVFLPSSKEWRPVFKPGTWVEYISHFCEVPMLTQGVVYKQMGDNPDHYIVLDYESEMEKHSEETFLDYASQISGKYLFPLRHLSKRELDL